MFGISVSGIKNSQKHLDVTSNNISNANSYGFKKSRAEFADVYANSVFSNNRIATGMGVNNTVVSQQFQQGNLSGDTGNSLDMAIQGNGFFVLSGDQQGGATNHTYTRNGAFQLNRDGYIVTATGEFLQGWDVNEDGSSTSLDLNSTHSIKLPADTGAPNATHNVGIGVNMPADKDPIKVPNKGTKLDGTEFTEEELKKDPFKYGYKETSTEFGDFTRYITNFDPKDSSTYTSSTSQTIHDSLGGAHTLTYYFLKMGPNGVEKDGAMVDGSETVWTVIPFVDGQPVDIASQKGADGKYENPAMISVAKPSNSSVEGANFFGFQVTFDSNGEIKKEGGLIPSKLELVNPLDGTKVEGDAEGDKVNPALDNSLRQALFGDVNKADDGELGEKGKDYTFETVTEGTAPDTVTTEPYYKGNGALYTALGVGINPYQNVNIKFEATQYGSSNFSVTSAPTNDGYSSGVLLGMEVTDEGIIQCQYSNGRVIDVAKVALADFTNVQGLNKIGDSQWTESRNSGQAIAREANQGSAGAIKGSNLELSNVDLTNELVELITAQRNYQANAQGLQTQNTVMDSILNIR